MGAQMPASKTVPEPKRILRKVAAQGNSPTAPVPAEVPKRGRGRPRKVPVDPSQIKIGVDGKNLPAIPKKRSTGVYDWDTTRLVFIEGEKMPDGTIRNYNQRQLADRMGIPYPTLRMRASRERWQARRDAYLIAYTQESSRKRIAELSQKSVDFDAKAFDTAEMGMAIVKKRLHEIMEESVKKEPAVKEAYERLARGESVARWELLSPIYHRELDGLASAAEKFQQIGMRALGTDIKKVDITGTEGLIQQNTLNIHQELTRDDPNRIAALIKALHETGLTERIMAGDEEEPIEGEVVSEEPPGEEITNATG